MDANQTDAELVLAARGGNRPAFAALVERHRPMLLALCTRMLGDRWLAEDVAQEATVQAMLSLDQLREPARFGAWLSGIGLNLARHWLKHRAADYWSLDALLGGRRVDEPIDGDASPAEQAEEAELAKQVRRAVDELPEGQRAAVLLFYLSGLTHAETAATLGVDVGAVKQRLHKARITLRRRLAPIWREPTMETAEIAELVEMRVADVRRVAAQTEGETRFVVVLEEVSGTRRLAIWIGRFEGEALALGLEKVQWPRPPTFAFTAKVLQAAGGRLQEIIVNKLVDEVFYAQAIVGRSGKPRAVDARPSDAINLALTTGAPIRVAAAVLEAGQKPPSAKTGPWPDFFAEGTAGAKVIAAEIAASNQRFMTREPPQDPARSPQPEP